MRLLRGKRWCPVLACALLVTLLGGCGSTGTGTTTAAPTQPAGAHEESGEASQGSSPAAEPAVRRAEAREKLESEQERVHGEEVAKEAERLTHLHQEPSEPPETALEQRERELGLGL
jgi:hypothetical protein